MRLIVRLLILITPLAADIPIATAKLGLNGTVTVVYSFLLFASSLAFLLLLSRKRLYGCPSDARIQFLLLLVYSGVILYSILMESDAVWTSRLVNLCMVGIIFLIALFLAPNHDREQYDNELPNLIYHAIGLYTVISVALFLLGIVVDDTKHDFSKLLLVFGIEARRQAMGLANGMNASGTIGGLSVFAGIAIYYSSRLRWLYRLTLSNTYIAAGLFSIAYSDTRSAILIVLICLLFSLFPRQLFRLGALPATIAILSLPILYITASTSSLSFLQGLSREQVSLLSSREIIWATSIDQILNPQFQHAFGYGYHGAETAGLHFKLQSIFNYDQLQSSHTAHNILLQNFFDSGYLGVTIFVLLVIAALSRYYKNAHLIRGGQYPAIIILYLLGIGATEAVPSLYWFSTFFIFFILTSWMIMRTPCRISFHDVNLSQKALLNGNTCHKKML